MMKLYFLFSIFIFVCAEDDRFALNIMHYNDFHARYVLMLIEFNTKKLLHFVSDLNVYLKINPTESIKFVSCLKFFALQQNTVSV